MKNKIACQYPLNPHELKLLPVIFQRVVYLQVWQDLIISMSCIALIIPIVKRLILSHRFIMLK